MALLEASIRSQMVNFSGLTALVATRVYPMILPAAFTQASITFERVSGTQELGMGTDVGVSEAKIQFDCWATGYSDAKNIAAQVKLAFLNFSGDMYGVYVYAVQVSNEMDVYDSSTKIYKTMVELLFCYQE